MPFENFYKETDELNDQRAVKIFLYFLGAVIFSVFGYAVVVNFLTDRDNKIEESARIKSIEATCNQLPMPDFTAFIGKNEPVTYDNGTVVTYRYDSKLSPENSISALSFELTKDGWKPSNNSTTKFYKNGVDLYIKNVPSESNIYEIDCFEGIISFGIYDISRK